MIMNTAPSPSQNKRRGSKKKALYDHDHHPFPFPKDDNFQKKGLSIYCQNCKAWVGWAKVNQKSQPSFMEMDNDSQCAH